MDGDCWSRRVLDYIPSNRMKRGRPPLSWMKGIERAMESRDLEEDDWLDRDEWRLE